MQIICIIKYFVNKQQKNLAGCIMPARFFHFIPSIMLGIFYFINSIISLHIICEEISMRFDLKEIF